MNGGECFIRHAFLRFLFQANRIKFKYVCMCIFLDLNCMTIQEAFLFYINYKWNQKI